MSNDTKRDGRSFESAIATLLQEFSFFQHAKISQNRKFIGINQPGEFEVDVAFEATVDGIMDLLIIVECKDWKRPVGREVIQKLIVTRGAIGAHKAFVASTSGYSEDAVIFAKANGIGLWIFAAGEFSAMFRCGIDRDYLFELYKAGLHARTRHELLEAIGLNIPNLHLPSTADERPVLMRLEALDGQLVPPFAFKAIRDIDGSIARFYPGLDVRTALAEIGDILIERYWRLAQIHPKFPSTPIKTYLAAISAIDNGTHPEFLALRRQYVIRNIVACIVAPIALFIPTIIVLWLTGDLEIKVSPVVKFGLHYQGNIHWFP